MPDFKNISLRPLTGAFDTLSSADEIGFGNWRVVKNCPTRSTRNRQRGGGWRRLFADDSPYNNSDLHDQLIDRLGYYESFTDRAFGGGGLSGYGYPYFSPSYTVDGDVVFPPAAGPYAPVYIGDFPSGIYNGCQIFYPNIGYPYFLTTVGSVNLAAMRAFWKMDEPFGSAAAIDYVGGLLLDKSGAGVVFGQPGVLNESVQLTLPLDVLYNSAGDSAFTVGDIKFGFTGWFKMDSSAGTETILSRWNAAGFRRFRLYLNAGQLTFEVSSDGTSVSSVTNSGVINTGEWVFFACWHDPDANTINVKVNNSSTASAVHSTGVSASSVTRLVLGNDDGGAQPQFYGSFDEIGFWKNGFPTETELLILFNGSESIDYPFSNLGGPSTGYPFYYEQSFLYASCPMVYPDETISGYVYGNRFPLYDPRFDYEYQYCGNGLFLRSGCREAVTMLQEVVVSSGRKLIAGTMSRIYELNQSSGNWRILVDGLGNAGYTASQCGCNSVRSMTATLGSYLLSTNNFDPPLIYILGDEATACDLNALQPIADLVALGITKAGGVVTWKGFTFFYDITEDGERKGGEIIWSDSEDPNSFIESDTSFAGRATVAVGATILNAAPLGNWLIFYTDKGIIRVTLVGGEDVFNFEDIYKGGNAMKYKFSLINTGDTHIYLGESDIYIFTQFDTRPINALWITKAAGMIFNGIEEDDATYSAINADACDLVTGGWNEETKEALLSWPTGENVCPNVTLRLNMKFNAADFIDHGFTAYLTFRKDDRPTVGEWIEDMGICARGSQVATGFKDGDVCVPGDPVELPPLYIRNETEDPNLPVDARSLCAALSGRTMDDFCRDCASATTFIAASAEDFTLKQLEDDIYYREMLGGNIEAYDAYSCHGEFYHHDGYDSAMQSGMEQFRSEDEKIIKRIRLEAEPLPQSVPSNLECDVGYSNMPTCETWKAATSLLFECQTEFTAAQHLAARTRQDGQFNFPVWRRGVYLAYRFSITGIGGGGTFSAMHLTIKGWGQAESP